MLQLTEDTDQCHLFFCYTFKLNADLHMLVNLAQIAPVSLSWNLPL